MNNLNVQIEALNKAIKHLERTIEDKQGEITSKQSEIDSFEFECTEAEFDDYLDDEGEQQTSVGSFYPSDILKNCDPVAYRCAKSDYESNYDLDDCEEYVALKDELESLESELEDLESELEDLESELEELQDELNDLLESDFQDKADNLDL